MNKNIFSKIKLISQAALLLLMFQVSFTCTKPKPAELPDEKNPQHR